MRNVTIKQLATELNVEYAQAAGLVHVMIAKGVARENGKQRNVTTAGKACKPSTIYEIPNSFTINLVAKDPLLSDAKRLAEIGEDSPMTESEKSLLVA